MIDHNKRKCLSIQIFQRSLQLTKIGRYTRWTDVFPSSMSWLVITLLPESAQKELAGARNQRVAPTFRRHILPINEDKQVDGYQSVSWRKIAAILLIDGSSERHRLTTNQVKFGTVPSSR